MTSWWIALLLFASCGRIGFAAHREDAATGGDADAVASAVDCWSGWRTGSIAVTSVTQVPISAVGSKSNPSLSPDLLTLYFALGPSGTRVINAMTRPARTASFGAAQPVANIDGPADETRLSVTADGLTGVLASNMTGSFDLYEVERAAANDFAAPSSALFNAIDTAGNEADPELAADGLRLYFTQGPNAGMQHIAMAVRPSRSSAFAAGALLAELADGTNSIDDPAVSPDERVIVFSDTIGGVRQLYTANRADRLQPFGVIAPLASTASAFTDGDAALAADGCELFFASNRTGTFEIWVATVAP